MIIKKNMKQMVPRAFAAVPRKFHSCLWRSRGGSGRPLQVRESYVGQVPQRILGCFYMVLSIF